jgi:hypothetical protein
MSRDVFHVGSGDNVLTGGNANDTFAFRAGFGRDVIRDFEHGDHIAFASDVFADFHAVQEAMHEVGADTVISLGTGHSITLQHVLVSSLQSSDFLLV